MATSINAMFLTRLQNICRIRPGHVNIQREKSGLVTRAREMQACEDVFQQMEADGIHLKKQPGAVRKQITKLPSRLKIAASVLLKKYPVSDLETHSKRLRAFLKVRKHKVTPEEYEELIAQKIKLMESRGALEEATQGPNYDELRARAVKKLKPAYNWSPMDYTGAKVIQYLGARLAGDYAAISACLREINLRDTDFYPLNVFDFGSGLGTTVWATSNIWKRIDDFYCVDHSVDMNTVARLLLQGGEEEGEMKLPVHFRTNMPSDKKNKFDLVACTFTLMELESEEDRQKLVESLWKMTEKYLVIVEKGGHSGFKLMNETREHLLKLSQESKEGHIFAPCPHQEACSTLTDRNMPCFFEAKYSTLEAVESKGTEKEWFSYMIFKVGPKPETHRSFPRLVDETLKRRSHTHCYLCCPDAKIRHIIFSRSFDAKLYKCTKTAMWGDMLPVKVRDNKEEQNSPSKDKNVESNVNKQSLFGDNDNKENLLFDNNVESIVDNHPNEELSADAQEKLSADAQEKFSTGDHEKFSSVHNHQDEETSNRENEELLADNEELPSDSIDNHLNKELSTDDNEKIIC